MIVKIQLPLFGSPEALIYNKDRSFMTTLPVDEEIVKLMTIDKTTEPKLFFKAHLDKNNKLVIEDYAKWQNW